MTDVSIGFITPGGMLISATAPSAAEALQQLVDIFGEDVATAYEQALQEVDGLIADADPRGLAPGLPAAQPAGGDDPGAGPEGVPGEDPATDSEVASDSPGQAPVERPVQAPEQPSEQPAAVADDEPCSICGGPVKAGLAALSKTTFGDVRCRTCGTW